MVIRSFTELERALKGSRPLRPAVAGAADPAALEALAEAQARGLIDGAFLADDAALLRPMLPLGLRVEIADTHDPAAVAVAEVRAGRADVLVKGRIDSAAYLRAVVARETGLRASATLSNVTLAEMPGLDRLIGATDNGIVPLPTLDQKRAMILNAVPLFRGLGVAPLRRQLPAPWPPRPPPGRSPVRWLTGHSAMTWRCRQPLPQRRGWPRRWPVAPI
jgi:phosphate butyryltransferase